jgi:hypothetical protein
VDQRQPHRARAETSVHVANTPTAATGLAERKRWASSLETSMLNVRVGATRISKTREAYSRRNDDDKSGSRDNLHSS